MQQQPILFYYKYIKSLQYLSSFLIRGKLKPAWQPIGRHRRPRLPDQGRQLSGRNTMHALHQTRQTTRSRKETRGAIAHGGCKARIALRRPLGSSSQLTTSWQLLAPIARALVEHNGRWGVSDQTVMVMVNDRALTVVCRQTKRLIELASSSIDAWTHRSATRSSHERSAARSTALRFEPGQRAAKWRRTSRGRARRHNILRSCVHVCACVCMCAHAYVCVCVCALGMCV